MSEGKTENGFKDGLKDGEVRKLRVNSEVNGKIRFREDKIVVLVDAWVTVDNGEGNKLWINVCDNMREVDYSEAGSVYEIAREMRVEAIEKSAKLAAELRLIVDFPPYGFTVEF